MIPALVIPRNWEASPHTCIDTHASEGSTPGPDTPSISGPGTLDKGLFLCQPWELSSPCQTPSSDPRGLFRGHSTTLWGDISQPILRNGWRNTKCASGHRWDSGPERGAMGSWKVPFHGADSLSGTLAIKTLAIKVLPTN